MKAFWYLLCITPLAFTLAVSPIVLPLARHLVAAIAASRADPYYQKIWWDWWVSWVFFGGPIGRWLWGAIFGFLILKDGRRSGVCSFVEEPRLGLFLVVLSAMVISVFALVNYVLLI